MRYDDILFVFVIASFVENVKVGYKEDKKGVGYGGLHT